MDPFQCICVPLEMRGLTGQEVDALLQYANGGMLLPPQPHIGPPPNEVLPIAPTPVQAGLALRLPEAQAAACPSSNEEGGGSSSGYHGTGHARRYQKEGEEEEEKREKKTRQTERKRHKEKENVKRRKTAKGKEKQEEDSEHEHSDYEDEQNGLNHNNGDGDGNDAEEGKDEVPRFIPTTETSNNISSMSPPTTRRNNYPSVYETSARERPQRLPQGRSSAPRLAEQRHTQPPPVAWRLNMLLVILAVLIGLLVLNRSGSWNW